MRAPIRVAPVPSTPPELREILDQHNRLIEAELADARCAVYLVEGGILRLASAPSMPRGFHAAADQLVADGAGPSAVSASTGQLIVCPDAQNDHRWPAAAAIARSHGIGSTWSTPIRADGEPIGVFTVYRASTGEPSERELRLTEVTVELARLAIVHVRREHALSLSEARARVSSRRLRALVDASPLAICEISPDGTVQLWNPAAERLLGWSSAEVVGGSSPAVTTDRHEEYLLLLERARNGEPVVDHETVRTAKDGREIDVSVSLAPVYDEHGEVIAFTSILIDISRRRILERRLMQAQKIEALGQLASSVAHDFSNVLTAIRGEAELAASTAQNPEVRSRIGRVIHAAEHGSELTRRLLGFGRITASRPEEVDLNAIVAEAVAMLERLLPPTIELELDLEEVPPVLGHPVELEQLLINLALNGRDAMPKGGILSITTGTYDGGVRLSVADSGSGMTSAVRQRILDPFFTTKDPGKGTGLGLAIVNDVVQRHRGKLSVESAEGKGTCFEVWFPVPDRSRMEAA